jgi:hypothetical protein
LVGTWRNKKFTDNKVYSLTNYDTKFEPGFEYSTENSGTAFMYVKTVYYKEAPLYERVVNGCGNDTSQCSQKKFYSLFMLDGQYSDNFEMLTFRDPLTAATSCRERFLRFFCKTGESEKRQSAAWISTCKFNK